MSEDTEGSSACVHGALECQARLNRATLTARHGLVCVETNRTISIYYRCELASVEFVLLSVALFLADYLAVGSGGARPHAGCVQPNTVVNGTWKLVNYES